MARWPSPASPLQVECGPEGGLAPPLCRPAPPGAPGDSPKWPLQPLLLRHSYRHCLKLNYLQVSCVQAALASPLAGATSPSPRPAPLPPRMMSAAAVNCGGSVSLDIRQMAKSTKAAKTCRVDPFPSLPPLLANEPGHFRPSPNIEPQTPITSPSRDSTKRGGPA